MADNYVLTTINPKMFVHPTPFNDVNLYRAESLPAICLGTMPADQMVILEKDGYCPYWGKCHKSNDDMEFANKQDMEKYVQELKLFSL